MSALDGRKEHSTTGQRQRRPATIIISIMFFMLWTVAAMTSPVARMDEGLTCRVQQHATPALDTAFSLLALTGDAEATGVLTLAMGAVLVRQGRAPAAAMLWAAFAGGTIVELTGKHWLPHAGVPLSLRRFRFQLLRQPIVPPYSYPSGHAFRTLLLVAAALMLWRPFPGRADRLLPVVFLGIAGLMGQAMIYLGGHWTSEVIGGYLLAATSAAFLRSGLSRTRLKAIAR